MPEMKFDVRWPDGKTTRCYSPSLVVTELLQQKDYPLFEFLERARAGLNIGSERVRQKFGVYCSAAMDQLAEIEETAKRFGRDDSLRVVGLYAPDSDPPPPLHDGEAETPKNTAR